MRTYQKHQPVILQMHLASRIVLLHVPSVLNAFIGIHFWYSSIKSI